MYLTIATIILFATVFTAVSLNNTQPQNLFILVAYAMITVYCFWRFGMGTRRAFTFRERLIKLDEDTTLKNALDLDT
jgi:cytochrome c biogenesis protein CcdA